jgi:hypothetical protein
MNVPRREGKRKAFKFGNLSKLGGKNGASVSLWDTVPGQRPGPQPADGFDKATLTKTSPRSKREAGAPDYHPKGSASDALWDDKADTYGRTGAMKDKPSYGPTDRAETPEEESSRGARMKVSDTVTILGDKNNGPYKTRRPVDADTRGRGKSIIKQNADQGNPTSLPTKEATYKARQKPKKSTSLWDD